MAAPTPTVRGTPGGIPVWDGYQVLYTLERYPTIKLYEKMVTPPGVEGGESIDQTTQHNSTWRTKKPRSLKELTNGQFTAGYDPAVLDQLVDAVNVEDTITALFCDGTTWAFFGYLKSFVPAQMQEGTMPEATCEIVPTNWDHVNNVEAGPAVASVAGT